LDDLAQYGEALKACERARVLQPGSSAVADRFFWLAQSRGEFFEALSWNRQAIEAEPTDDFDLYWNRATLFLALALASPTRSAIESGLSATKDDIGTDAALVRVVYCEGGKAALRTYIESVHLEQSSNATKLQEAAYSRLLLGDAAAVKALVARALVAPDRLPGFAESPWYARGERAIAISYRLDLAAADIALGDRIAATREADIVLAMVNKMIAGGVERYATYELRAEVYALQGKNDEAMQDLTKAAQLGWHRAWWATHEPYLTGLRNRSDFKALIAQVNRSNDLLINKLKANPSGYSLRLERPLESATSCSDSG
jgi:tetratricopeptide (TPR) repeat protein